MAEYINREVVVKAFNNFDAGKACGTHSTLLTHEEFAEYLQYSEVEINQCFDFAASRLRVKPDPVES